jgi:hypothetical protein
MFRIFKPNKNNLSKKVIRAKARKLLAELFGKGK